MDEADLLMDRPPGGWGGLVTKDWLHLELSVVNTRFDAVDGRLDKLEERMTSLEREFRALTWKLVGTMTGLFAALAIVIKL